MPRHRGTFKPERPEPYEVSRSKIEGFIKCPACFWLDRVKGVKFPSIPAFTLNSATDTLLKKDFDYYREQQTPHPFMVRHGLEHLVPFQHPEFEKWTQSLQLGFNTLHEQTNLLIGGGIDDIWHNRDSGELHVVDYKSTATGRNNTVSLEGHYKKAYKRQIDIYQWILKDKGFPVSDIGYFVYVDADQHGPAGMLSSDKNRATMQFSAVLLPYRGQTDWVDSVIGSIAKTLREDTCPPHASTGFGRKGVDECEHARFLKGVANITAASS